MNSHYIAVLLTFFLFTEAALVRADTPILKFPEGISWKGVFDSGLRPKHVSGLEEVIVECKEQELVLAIGDPGNLFVLDEGRLSIELMHEQRLRRIEHVSHVPISMEEGEIRLKKFREIFDSHLVRTGSMPVIMDKQRGSVMAISDQHAVAKISSHVFTFGFTSSFQKDRPLIAVFQLAWIRPEGEPRPPIRRKIVAPPEGYEWYSLDPKVHTPDPGSDPEPLPKPEMEPLPNPEIKIPEKETPELQADEVENKSSDKPKDITDESRLSWWMICVFGLITATMLFWFWRSKSTP